MPYIKEIFESIQGEGLYVGEKQVFIRFCGCNLKCAYCDTEHRENNAINYDIENLLDKITEFDSKTVSFTGGEPLLQADFLKKLLPELKNRKFKIYLETNGTMPDKLREVVEFIDVIAMDIKLKSATGEENRFKINREFINIAKEKTFVKVVFNDKITEGEISEIIKILNGTPLILQPEMPIKRGFDINSVFEKFYKLNQNVRLIPQCHKFLNLR